MIFVLQYLRTDFDLCTLTKPCNTMVSTCRNTGNSFTCECNLGYYRPNVTSDCIPPGEIELNASVPGAEVYLTSDDDPLLAYMMCMSYEWFLTCMAMKTNANEIFWSSYS